MVDVPLQLEVQEVPAQTEVQRNSTCTHDDKEKPTTAQMHLLVKVFGSAAAELQVSGLTY